MDLLARHDHARRKYAETWSSIDAAHFATEGHYAWMASFLEGHPRVLEIGAGDGRATHELVRRGHEVIGIDVARRASPSDMFMASGGRSSTELRQSSLWPDPRVGAKFENDDATHGYYVEYEYPSHSGKKADALLVDADVYDGGLLPWLVAASKFDAVTLWLAGSSGSRRGSEDASMHRLALEERAFEVANSVLSPGGRLQFVYRSATQLTPSLEVELHRHHRDEPVAGSGSRPMPRHDDRLTDLSCPTRKYLALLPCSTGHGRGRPSWARSGG